MRSNHEDGVRFGAGIERMLTGIIYAKAEYHFAAYGDDVERQQILAGVGFRFWILRPKPSVDPAAGSPCSFTETAMPPFLIHFACGFVPTLLLLWTPIPA